MNTLKVAGIYACAAAVGYVASALRIPLPWMIGPMVFAGLTSIADLDVRVPGVTRPIGQTVVAATVGLSFTPAAVAAIGFQIIPMIAAALLTVLAGFLAAAALMKMTRIDAVSASLASIPGGPVEMAALATRHGVAPGPVAFAQTLRIALLVLVIPPLLVALDGNAGDPADFLTDVETDYFGAALLVALATSGGFAFRYMGITSPFFLGPLGSIAVASALAVPVAMPPWWLLAGAQVLLGVWLGRMFDRQLFARSGRFVPAVFASTIVLMILCALMAFAISEATGIRWQTAVLATAPGSVTEMALTAKILQQGVALVAAFHVVRIFIILPAAPLIFEVTARLTSRPH